MPNGETLAAMTHRVDSFIRDVRQSADRRVLAVAHAHLIRLVAARWLGLEPAQAALFRWARWASRIWVGNASVPSC